MLGKPTIINFWFAKCAPCIDELPYLLKLKEKFNKKANFVGITFDSRFMADEFLKKKDFNYTHITNSKSQINDLKISSYPMTYILDKNGDILNAYGGLSNYEFEEISNNIGTMLQ